VVAKMLVKARRWLAKRQQAAFHRRYCHARTRVRVIDTAKIRAPCVNGTMNSEASFVQAVRRVWLQDDISA